MANRRTNEQAMIWLKSMAADRNSLDGINAELCLNLIQEQKDRLEKLGAQFQQVKNSRDNLLRERKQILESIENVLDTGLSEEQKAFLRDNGVEVVEF